MTGRGNRRDLSKKQRALQTDTAERLEAIVEAAERAAENVIDDAEAQARRYLAESRERADREASLDLSTLAELTDSLLEEATALRLRAERLQETLEAAKSRIDNGREPEPVPRLRAIGPRDDPSHAAEASRSEEQGRRADAAGARLLATQMAVSGSSREEIEARLRNRFEIEDTSAILDAILGPEDGEAG